MRIRRIAAILALLSTAGFAQVELPDVSQAASVSQRIGTTDLAIEYHRPGVKGRAIFGGLVPYDQPWRLGANDPTTLEISDPVTIEGVTVPAGKYSFFAIPGRDSWTMVLNKNPQGAFGYDPAAEDQYRFTVRPTAAPRTEWMRFTIDPVTPESAVITLNWHDVAVPMNVSVDVPALVWSEVDRTLNSALNAAAGWALSSEQRLEDGLAWADQSIARRETITNLWTKARILQKLGRSREAIPVMERSLALARGNVSQNFVDVLEDTLRSIRADAAK